MLISGIGGLPHPWYNAHIMVELDASESCEDDLGRELLLPQDQPVAREDDSRWLKGRTRPALVQNPSRTLNIVDLFSGCGGLSLGAFHAACELRLGFQSALAWDNDKAALAVYAANFQPVNRIGAPIDEVISADREASRKALETHLKGDLGVVDLVVAGPPCQGHSDLNNHTRRTDRRNALYETVGHFAALTQPKALIIENVPSVVHDEGGSMARTWRVLEGLGYRVDAGLVDLSTLGVPQTRKRHILVAARITELEIADLLKPYRIAEPRNLRWAIGDLEDQTSDALVDQPTVLSDENRRRIKYLFENGKYDLPNPERPKCHRDGNHSYNSMYGRLAWHKPAQTITTGFTSPGQGRFIHPSRQRTLTPHEAARLQYFPDWFDFSAAGQRGAVARVIGNAVPMKLASVLVQALAKRGVFG